MLTNIQPFTDCHGIQHTAAVIQIAQANYNGNNSMHIAAEGDSYIERHSNVNHSVNYQALIWIDAAAKLAGMKPLSLRDKNGNDRHTVVLPGPLSDSTEIVELCEQHILTTIIPQLTQATTQE
jgi:hypothetical protein